MNLFHLLPNRVVEVIRGAALALVILPAAAEAQNGGMITVGHGKVGDAFTLHKMSCTLQGNGPAEGRPRPALLGRWWAEGAKSRYESGDDIHLPPGKYTLYFKPLAGWDLPALHGAEVKLSSDKTFTALYRRLGQNHGGGNKTAVAPESGGVLRALARLFLPKEKDRLAQR